MSVKSKFSKVSIALFSGATLGATMLVSNDSASADEIYTVKEGDTLSEISYAFNLDGDYMSIAKANKLADADFITIGQKLVITDNGTVKQATKKQVNKLPEVAKNTTAAEVAASSSAVSSSSVATSTSTSSSASSSSASSVSSSSAVSSSSVASSSSSVASSSSAVSSSSTSSSASVSSSASSSSRVASSSSSKKTVVQSAAPKQSTPKKATPAPKPATPKAPAVTNNASSSKSNGYTGGSSVASVASEMQSRTGVSAATWQRIIMRESGGNANISNATSGAYGLFQLLGHGEYRGMSVAEQINMATSVYNAQGLGAWGE